MTYCPTSYRFMKKKVSYIKQVFTCIILAIICLAWATSASMAAGPDHLSLQSFSVLKEQGQLIVRAPIDIEPREAMRAMLRDGAQTLLTCTATLERERTLWTSATVATSTAAMVLSYDPLSRQYVLSTALPEDFHEDSELSEEPKEQESDPNMANGRALQNAPIKQENDKRSQGKPRRDTATLLYGHRDFNALMDNTLGRLRMPLCATSLLEPDEQYFATIRVELRHTKVPPWLSQTLFFWSWDVVPSIEFSQTVQGE